MENMITKTFDVTAESGDEQIISGWLTRDTVDRHLDIVKPAGVDTSQLKVLLENHDHSRPVGRVLDLERRAEGIFGRFKVVAEDAWQKCKEGLYPALSIGFIPIASEPRKGGGWTYTACELLECSLVSCPSNRESLITELKSAPEEGNTMSNEANAPVGKTVKRVAPAVHTEKHEYSLQRAMKGVLENRTPDGLEGETDQEMRHAQPWREYGGCAVPLEQVFLSKEQRAEIQKASGVVSPSNLAPLVGEEYRDELFALIDAAIGKQLLSGQVGSRVLTGLTEQTVRIPRQTAMMSAGHVTIDSDLPDSSDPTFSNQTMTPKLVGSVAQLQLSAVLAQHPRISTDYFGSELRRALTQEVERVFLNGDNTTNPEEPDGLVNLADDSNTLTIATATALADINAVSKAYRDYTQTNDAMLNWVMPPELIEAMETEPAFLDSAYPMSETLKSKGINYIPALDLPFLTDTYTGFVGNFSYHVHGIWQGIDLSLNPYADSVFAKKATLLRVSMMHDYQVIDPKRILQVAVTP